MKVVQQQLQQQLVAQQHRQVVLQQLQRLRIDEWDGIFFFFSVCLYIVQGIASAPSSMIDSTIHPTLHTLTLLCNVILIPSKKNYFVRY
jgi:hypothetical protein